MSDLLDRGDTALDRWKAGPRQAALAKLLGEPPVGVLLERVHFPGKRPVQLVYAAKLRSGLVCSVLAESCRDPQDGAARTIASLRKSRNGQRSALNRPAVVADSESGMILRNPGLDDRLPGLRLLYDGSFARDVVETLTGRDHPGPITTRLMAHRLGKRAVVRIDLGDRRLFARLHATKSDDGARRLERHRAVWATLFPGDPLAIPEPLGARPDIGLSLFGELPGRPPQLDRDHEAVARSLATLRDLDLSDLQIHAGADEAVILRAWRDRCRRYLPGLASIVAPTMDRICGQLEASAATPRPCHRDLHEKQILVSPKTAGILDFDTLSLADPALDPGNLLAHLFLARIDEGPLARSLGGPNVALWRRAALLRLAMIYAFTATPDAEIRRLLKEAEG